MASKFDGYVHVRPVNGGFVGSIRRSQEDPWQQVIDCGSRREAEAHSLAQFFGVDPSKIAVTCGETLGENDLKQEWEVSRQVAEFGAAYYPAFMLEKVLNNSEIERRFRIFGPSAGFPSKRAAFDFAERSQFAGISQEDEIKVTPPKD